MTDLKTQIGNISLRNPLILAAGVLGTSFSSIKRVYNNGFGAMVSKSIGIEPNSGYVNPTIFLLPETRSAMNAVGLANPGVEDFFEKMKPNLEEKLPIIYSIYGNEADQIKAIIETLNQLNPLAYELNVSCPHGGKFGLSVSHDEDLFKLLVTTAKKYSKCPIWVKLSPNAVNITDYAEIAISSGADAIVAINTLKAMVIDIETMTPVLANKAGGLSGKAIKPVGVRAVYDLYSRFPKTPIIGVGGIETAEDVIEYLLAGASAVEIGTAFAYTEDQDKLGSKINLGLQNYLKEKGLRLEELIGKAHKE
ncbi:MAG: dihydroorotate dehydrogenase [Candidatus Kariarchaeaceae archaeon]